MGAEPCLDQLLDDPLAVVTRFLDQPRCRRTQYGEGIVLYMTANLYPSESVPESFDSTKSRNPRQIKLPKSMPRDLGKAKQTLATLLVRGQPAAACITVNEAPCGSISPAKRPIGMSTGSTVTVAPRSRAFATVASQSATAKQTPQCEGT